MAWTTGWRSGRATRVARRVRRTAVISTGTLVLGLLPAGVAVAASPEHRHVSAPAAPHDKRIPFTHATPKRGPARKGFKHFDPAGHAKLPRRAAPRSRCPSRLPPRG
ncbi:hypothetical protein O1M54_42755 [Streptomyces diastatochromogenes]|nr:hypothetical protein [Streptomyces diastatochromogenes]